MGHLPGAINIPAEQITEGMSGRADLLLTSRILVYCAGGSRSAAAAAQLRAAGYRHVVDGGGMADARADFVP
jgi:rhodanese-related sulfurtransferase